MTDAVRKQSEIEAERLENAIRAQMSMTKPAVMAASAFAQSIITQPVVVAILKLLVRKGFSEAEIEAALADAYRDEWQRMNGTGIITNGATRAPLLKQ